MKFNWGHGIFIFIIIFLCLAISFIIFALRQTNDLVADDYYNRGANYSQQIEINRRSAPFADSIAISSSNTSVQLKTCKSLVSKSIHIKVLFFRPSDKAKDFSVEVQSAEQINISVANKLNGRYIAKLSWTMNDKLYSIDKEIFIK